MYAENNIRPNITQIAKIAKETWQKGKETWTEAIGRVKREIRAEHKKKYYDVISS